MSGCYGNHSEDRARERELNAWLERHFNAPEVEKVERCAYCGEDKGEKISCCGEIHFETVEIDSEDSDEAPDPDWCREE